MTIFYFTSTGNCLAVAKSIASSENVATLISIPQVIRQQAEHSPQKVSAFGFLDWKGSDHLGVPDFSMAL